MSGCFKSINSIEIYELDDEKQEGLESDRPKLKIKEHWNRRDFVVIEIDNKSITVLAEELRRAINNAQNAHY